jgi:hypothetical protein
MDIRQVMSDNALKDLLAEEGAHETFFALFSEMPLVKRVLAHRAHRSCTDNLRSVGPNRGAVAQSRTLDSGGL